MALPTFLIIGAQKAGTTSLAHYLRRHPAVFLPALKEPGFFVEEFTWSFGLEWYESLFAGATDASAIGEATTSYTMFPSLAGVPARIGEVLPDVRLIYLVRDPVERMRSAYAHALAAGSERRPIREALLHDARYADASRYAMQIDQYLKVFDRDRLLIVDAADLRGRRAQTLDAVLGFIGLEPGWRPADLDREHNITANKRAPRALTRAAGGLLIRAGAGRRPAPRQGPPSWRRSRWLSRPLAPAEIEIDDDLRSRLREALRSDMERFGRLLAPGFDGWGLL